ncbi:WxL protein peptidoglycan domain-containing protein [Streptomyces formicae]|uniref:DUF916 domain-containing protein n=1 Tax=Streptomyces formicae TaxID=1616117 RepID=A0ABY3WQZ8_9ACTN|nr:DUF916 domain-containing protein [Streptomyces formicae]UNM15078.1 DUF916 domain-containing protein [Streptomyces formicae]
MPRPRLYAAVLVAAVLLGLLAPAPAHAADNGRWSVHPAAASEAAAALRPYFYLSADPGSRIEDKVTVTNKSAGPMTFRLYGADAYNTVRDGGFAVRTERERQLGVGAWLRAARQKITLPPGGTATVPFTLTVPETAEPGDHPGALVALDERVEPGPGSLAVGVQQAVGARIYLRVTGPTVAALAVEDVTYEPDRPLVPGTGTSRARISYTLHNRGNVTLNPKAALRAEGLFGRTLLARELTKLPGELLPRQKIRLTESWADAPQLDWGEITVTARARDVRESAAGSFFVVPWLVAAVLLAAGAGAAVWLRVRHRRVRGT